MLPPGLLAPTMCVDPGVIPSTLPVPTPTLPSLDNHPCPSHITNRQAPSHEHHPVSRGSPTAQGVEGDEGIDLLVHAARLNKDKLTAEIDGQRFTADVACYPSGDHLTTDMWLGQHCYGFRRAVPRRWMPSGAAAVHSGAVQSPLPGKIVKVRWHCLKADFSGCVPTL